MADKAQLIARTLSILGKAEAGQTPDEHDVDHLASLIPSCVADLNRKRIVTIEDVESLDDDLLQWVALYLAQFVAPDFGLPMSAEAMELAKRNLRENEAITYVHSPLAVDYF